ncbi:aldo/keto reductase [Coriobacterium glomerans PW2]|uniref:Aldo/keto reductase n=1 Tax=Coriobacterium glomerans (strain ATCC 49209 / DSM 20642 / JCM 10262 / PW2) TaxID=700015 RepID=F2N8K5_CORGP|nr:aldo/keto reductase [Coriobacterium glomerans]AEB07388.1 aldo/keto reductase [Coriobacterium glomerans PW2]
MQYRQDGRGGRRISALGLGCMRFPGFAIGRPDLRSAEAIIARAHERGINYLDTAYLYPGNEACVGAALQRLGLRDAMIVATKLPHGSCRRPEDLDRILDIQLRRLRTDRIDCYLIHNICAPAQWKHLQSMGIEAWLARQRSQGRLGAVGFSYHGSAADFPVLLDAYPWDFCQIQYNYLNERYQAGTAGLIAAHARGMGVFVMEPLLGGRLAGKLPDEAKRILAEAGRDPTRASVRGRGRSRDVKSVSALETPAAWALAWVLDHAEVTMALSGMTSAEQVDENVDIACRAEPGSMSADELDVIARVVEVVERCGRIACTGCAYCMPCPAGINIPGCFSAYNASFAHSWFTGVQQYLIASGGLRRFLSGSASRCMRCGRCLGRCPQKIAIPDRLHDVARRLTPWYPGAYRRGVRRSSD